jgi:hypothetical protein
MPSPSSIYETKHFCESNKNKEKGKNYDASLYFVTVMIKNQPTKKVSKFVKKQQIKTFT